MQITTNTVSHSNVSLSANVNSTKETSFSINTENKKAVEITYEEYKKLSIEDIEELYPKESMPKENAKAMTLHTKANYSDDEILNQVLFDKELEFNDGVAHSYVSDFFNSLYRFWPSFKEPLEVNDKHADLIKLPVNTQPISKEDLKLIEADKKKWEEWRKEDKIPADFLFSVFEHNEMDFIQNQEYYKNSKHPFRVHGKEILAIYDSIKVEYEKRTSEANAALNSYTKNTKPNILNN